MSKVDYEAFLNKDIFSTKQEIKELYGEDYAKFYQKNLIIKDEDVFNSYKNEDLLEVKTSKGYTYVSRKLVMDLIFYEGMYYYLLTRMEDKINSDIRLSLFKNGYIKDFISIDRASICKVLSTFTSANFPSIMRMRIANIENYASLYSFREYYGKETFEVNIEGAPYIVDPIDLFDLLISNEEDYNEFINNEEIVFNINGILTKTSNKIIAYILVLFIDQEGIIDKYNLSDDIIRRFELLKSNQKIDFESINEMVSLPETNEINLTEKVDIDQELEKRVMEGINNTYSDLEKAIFIYIKLCQLLSYDQSFYVSSNKEDNFNNRINLDIDHVTLENNDVISYEFILIYASLLDKLGITYKINKIGNSYDEMYHTTINFKFAEYLITCDAIKDIINGDMVNAKINAPINGLEAINKNELTKQKFNEILYKVMMDIWKYKEDKEIFNDVLTSYKEKFTKILVSREEKVYLLLEELGRKNLKGVDTISYQKRVFESIIGNDPNIKMHVLSNNERNDHENTYSPVIIISIYQNEEYVYFKIDPNDSKIIEKIANQELKELLISKIYTPISPLSEEIPGMKVGNYHVI